MMLLFLLLQSVMSWPTKKICMIFCYSRSVNVELIFLLHPFLCFPHPRRRGWLCKLFFSFSAEFVKTLNPFFAIQGRHRIRKTFFLSSSLCSSVNYFGGASFFPFLFRTIRVEQQPKQQSSEVPRVDDVRRVISHCHFFHFSQILLH